MINFNGNRKEYMSKGCMVDLCEVEGLCVPHAVRPDSAYLNTLGKYTRSATVKTSNFDR